MMRADSKGFTLIEMIIYIAILSLILTVVIVLMYSLLISRNQSSQADILAANAQSVTQRISSAVRGAQTITTPAVDASASTLSLTDADGDDLTFSLSTGMLTVSVNGSSPVAITDTAVEITDVLFTNYSFSNESLNTIRIQAHIAPTDVRFISSTSIDFFTSIR